MTFAHGVGIHKRPAPAILSGLLCALWHLNRTDARPYRVNSSSHTTAPIRTILSPSQPCPNLPANPSLLAAAPAFRAPLPAARRPATMPSPRRPATVGALFLLAALAPDSARAFFKPSGTADRGLPVWALATGGVVLALIFVCLCCVLFRAPRLRGADSDALREAAAERAAEEEAKAKAADEDEASRVYGAYAV